jgi:Ca2+-binding EF-hand superfamily protein
MNQLFRLYDTNSDGVLSKDELIDLLVEALTTKHTLTSNTEIWMKSQAPAYVAITARAKASSMLRKYDADKNKCISFDEFVGIVLEHQTLMASFSYWKHLFVEIDTDGNVTLNPLVNCKSENIHSFASGNGKIDEMELREILRTGLPIHSTEILKLRLEEQSSTTGSNTSKGTDVDDNSGAHVVTVAPSITGVNVVPPASADAAPFSAANLDVAAAAFSSNHGLPVDLVVPKASTVTVATAPATAAAATVASAALADVASTATPSVDATPAVSTAGSAVVATTASSSAASRAALALAGADSAHSSVLAVTIASYAAAVMAEADNNSDGFIDFEEFVKFARLDVFKQGELFIKELWCNYTT